MQIHELVTKASTDDTDMYALDTGSATNKITFSVIKSAITSAVFAGAGAFAGAVSGTAATFTGALSAASATITGAITAASATLSGNLTAVKGIFSGDVSGVKGTFSGAISGDSLTVTNGITADDGGFNGDVTGTTGTFGTLAAISGTADAFTATTLTASTINGIDFENTSESVTITNITYGSGYIRAYRRGQFVHLSINIQTVTAFSSEKTIGTLSSGFRPISTSWFQTTGDIMVTVGTDGTIKMPSAGMSILMTAVFVAAD